MQSGGGGGGYATATTHSGGGYSTLVYQPQPTQTGAAPPTTQAQMYNPYLRATAPPTSSAGGAGGGAGGWMATAPTAAAIIPSSASPPIGSAQPPPHASMHTLSVPLATDPSGSLAASRRGSAISLGGGSGVGMGLSGGGAYDPSGGKDGSMMGASNAMGMAAPMQTAYYTTSTGQMYAAAPTAQHPQPLYGYTMQPMYGYAPTTMTVPDDSRRGSISGNAPMLMATLPSGQGQWITTTTTGGDPMQQHHHAQNGMTMMSVMMAPPPPQQATLATAQQAQPISQQQQQQQQPQQSPMQMQLQPPQQQQPSPQSMQPQQQMMHQSPLPQPQPQQQIQQPQQQQQQQMQPQPQQQPMQAQAVQQSPPQLAQPSATVPSAAAPGVGSAGGSTTATSGGGGNGGPLLYPPMDSPQFVGGATNNNAPPVATASNPLSMFLNMNNMATATPLPTVPPSNLNMNLMAMNAGGGMQGGLQGGMPLTAESVGVVSGGVGNQWAQLNPNQMASTPNPQPPPPPSNSRKRKKPNNNPSSTASSVAAGTTPAMPSTAAGAMLPGSMHLLGGLAQHPTDSLSSLVANMGAAAAAAAAASGSGATQPAASAASSSSKPRSSGAAARAADNDARATRIRKHNEAEVRRRQRLKNLLTDLSHAVLCSKTHKSLILRTAIDRVRAMKDKLASLGVDVRTLLLSTGESNHPGDDSGEEDDPSALAQHGFATQDPNTAAAVAAAAMAMNAAMASGGLVMGPMGLIPADPMSFAAAAQAQAQAQAQGGLMMPGAGGLMQQSPPQMGFMHAPATSTPGTTGLAMPTAVPSTMLMQSPFPNSSQSPQMHQPTLPAPMPHQQPQPVAPMPSSATVPAGGNAPFGMLPHPSPTGVTLPGGGKGSAFGARRPSMAPGTAGAMMALQQQQANGIDAGSHSNLMDTTAGGAGGAGTSAATGTAPAGAVAPTSSPGGTTLVPLNGGGGLGWPGPLEASYIGSGTDMMMIPPAMPSISHHTLFHSAAVAMDVIDHMGNILDCNAAFARFVGYSREVLLEKGTTFLGLTHPDSLAASYKLMSPLVSGQRKVTRAVKKYICGDGSVKNSIVTCWLLHNDSVRDLGARTGPIPDVSAGAPDSSSSGGGNGSGGVAPAPSPSASPSSSRLLLQAMIEEIPLDMDERALDALVQDKAVLDSIKGGPGAAPSAADLKGEGKMGPGGNGAMSPLQQLQQLQQQQQQGQLEVPVQSQVAAEQDVPVSSSPHQLQQQQAEGVVKQEASENGAAGPTSSPAGSPTSRTLTVEVGSSNNGGVSEAAVRAAAAAAATEAADAEGESSSSPISSLSVSP